MQSSKIDRILAVDDMPDNLVLIETILEDEGYEIILASDGITALAEIEKSPPDLLLLDVMMPVIDGYEVTRRVRKNPKLPYIPILLITAHDQSSLIVGLDAGADDFVRKPVDPEELSARVRSLLRLKHSIDEREQMVLQREDFIAHLTHDLRTPLVAADIMLGLFKKEAFCPISQDMQQAVSALIRSNQSLMQIVDTLLEVHSHESGAKKFTFINCNLWEIAQDVVQELTPLAEEKGLSLQLKLLAEDNTNSEKPEIKVVGDSLELRRMLTNLLGNAIKFTNLGYVEIRINSSDNYQGNSWVTLEVQDTGIGFSEEEKATLFQRFRKGKHKKSGSGLGLHLVHRIVQVHQGTIEASSQLEEGTLFSIRLPKQLQ
jgi:two-component system, sensor histidine kinase and response regulator